MSNPNDMTTWEHIACARGEGHQHHTRQVMVDLADGHGYHDYPAIPERLAVRFPMFIWDPEEHPIDGGPYCPAHDAVSETILALHVWEPRETALFLDVLGTPIGDRPTFLDIGAQIGWFTLCALAGGARVIAVDAELENLGLLGRSAQEIIRPATVSRTSTEEPLLTTRFARVGPEMDPFPVRPYRLVKIDIEGAEADALAALAPALAAGMVDHLSIEVSPVFKPGGHYPDLVVGLIDAGFEAYTLPPKQQPPVPYNDAESFLAPYRIDTLPTAELRDLVESCGQEDVWFRRAGAAW